MISKTKTLPNTHTLPVSKNGQILIIDTQVVPKRDKARPTRGVQATIIFPLHLAMSYTLFTSLPGTPLTKHSNTAHNIVDQLAYLLIPWTAICKTKIAKKLDGVGSSTRVDEHLLQALISFPVS